MNPANVSAAAPLSPTRESAAAPLEPSRPLPVAAIVATVCMAINAAVGLSYGLTSMERSSRVATLGIVFGLAWICIAVGAALLRPGARATALLLAGFSIVVAGRIEPGPNLFILVLLLTPSARLAFSPPE